MQLGFLLSQTLDLLKVLSFLLVRPISLWILNGFSAVLLADSLFYLSYLIPVLLTHCDPCVISLAAKKIAIEATAPATKPPAKNQ